MLCGFILDMGITPKAIELLVEYGIQVIHIRDKGKHTDSDNEILAYARSLNFGVITIDLDFCRIVTLEKANNPTVITLRLEDYSSYEQVTTLKRLFNALALQEMDAQMITLEEDVSGNIHYRSRNENIDKNVVCVAHRSTPDESDPQQHLSSHRRLQFLLPSCPRICEKPCR